MEILKWLGSFITTTVTGGVKVYTEALGRGLLVYMVVDSLLQEEDYL